MCLERVERQYKADSLRHAQATKTQGGASQILRQARAFLLEEKLIAQRGGFLLPLLSANLPTLASLIFRNHVT